MGVTASKSQRKKKARKQNHDKNTHDGGFPKHLQNNCAFQLHQPLRQQKRASAP
jgi:hypothetical protein